MSTDITATIRNVLREHGRLAEDLTVLSDTSDLFEAGLSSHASVNLMLALEEHFNIEFSERMLQRRTFASIAAIRSCVASSRDRTPAIVPACMTAMRSLMPSTSGNSEEIITIAAPRSRSSFINR